jgi:hypothetical protein
MEIYREFTPEIRIAVAETMTTGATALVTTLRGSVGMWSSVS